MRLLLTIGIIFLCVQANAQNCRPTIAVTIKICRDISNDSLSAYCVRRAEGLVASDSNFSITGFIMRAEGPGFEDYIEEALNTGAYWNETRRVLLKLRAGSHVEFTCIKAKYKNSDNIFILQPLVLVLR